MDITIPPVKSIPGPPPDSAIVPTPVSPASTSIQGPSRGASKQPSDVEKRVAKRFVEKWKRIFSKDQSLQVTPVIDFKKINVRLRPGKRRPANLTDVYNPEIAYSILEKTFYFTDDHRKKFHHNINVMAKLLASRNKSAIIEGVLAFSRAHMQMLAPSDFDLIPALKKNRMKAYLDKLDEQLRLAEEEENTILKEDPPPMPDTQQRLGQFFSSLDSLRGYSPLSLDLDLREKLFSGRKRGVSIRNASAGDGKATSIKIERYGDIAQNIDGDLYCALAGRNLKESEIIEIRGRVALVRHYMPAGQEGRNADLLVAGLRQTPEYADMVDDMVAGLDAIPNEVLGYYQAVPGMYAGEVELAQWTSLMGNKKKMVVVIDADGSLRVYSDGKGKSISRNELDAYVLRADILLHKQGTHWKKIEKNKRFTLSTSEAVCVKFQEASISEDQLAP